MTAIDDSIHQFFAGQPHAVVGASRDPEKYGHKVFHAFLNHGRPVYPVNPHCEEIDGHRCYPDLASLPERPYGISVVTPPAATEHVIEEAARLGIQHVWLQPGAESDRAIELAKSHGLNIIAGGPCVMVLLPQLDAAGSGNDQVR